jgi:hypothetical protein
MIPLYSVASTSGVLLSLLIFNRASMGVAAALQLIPMLDNMVSLDSHRL